MFDPKTIKSILTVTAFYVVGVFIFSNYGCDDAYPKEISDREKIDDLFLWVSNKHTEYNKKAIYYILENRNKDSLAYYLGRQEMCTELSIHLLELQGKTK